MTHKVSKIVTNTANMTKYKQEQTLEVAMTLCDFVSHLVCSFYVYI